MNAQNHTQPESDWLDAALPSPAAREQQRKLATIRRLIGKIGKHDVPDQKVAEALAILRHIEPSDDRLAIVAHRLLTDAAIADLRGCAVPLDPWHLSILYHAVEYLETAGWLYGEREWVRQYEWKISPTSGRWKMYRPDGTPFFPNDPD